MKEKRKSRINLFLPLIVILVLMVGMVIYTSRVIRDVAVANIHEVGEDRISGAAAQLESYLEMTKSTLWVTADSVDFMVRNGATSQEVLSYLTEQTDNLGRHFDENYVGLYGYIKGEYLDGAGWVPPKGYLPTERDWYRDAIEAKGDIIIVPPYVDAQTGSVVMSVSRMLSDGKDVLSLDVKTKHIQETIASLYLKEKGYGFIVNREGLIIAHHEESQKGRHLGENKEEKALLARILKVENGEFETRIHGEKSTGFVHSILDQWYVVLIIGNRELYAEAWQQMLVNIVLCTAIFILIAVLFILGYRNEQKYSHRIEEMREEERKQAFETKILRLEKEAADQANKAKSDFLADMSHEIRTPINAVLGMNEMILRESVQAREGEGRANIISYARNIESAGNNLLAIINDILDFSKIEAGKIELVQGNYQLSSVLNDLSNMFTFKARDKGLLFQMNVEETLPDGLYGDEVRIRQIITNILNNAVKYTQHGRVRLSFQGDPRGPAASGQTICLVVTVEDTGIGIRPEDMDKLFTKFQRLDLKNNSTVEGTGLGLVISNTLLDMMGGTIEVKSEYGKGSIFTMRIPQKVVLAEPIGDFHDRFQNSMQNVKAYKESFRAPEARVLIVDDTRMNLTVVVGLLKNTCLKIDTASNGEEAAALAAAQAYDLILMDQRMPRMDGTEALHKIRAQAEGPNCKTPVICLTADSVMGARERYIAEGFTDYLTKPIDSRALEQMMIRYLPAEKVLIVKEAPLAHSKGQGENGEGKGEPFGLLRTAGIDPEIGLYHCENDEDLYRSLLQEYLWSADEKRRELQSSYEKHEWKDYAVSVHSLKSTSLMIGAKTLSEMAEELEKAAEQEHLGRFGEEQDQLMACYDAVIRTIKQLPGIHAMPAEEIAMGEDEILEFLPDTE